MANFLLERDALKGFAGVAYMVIDGEYTELFQLRNINLDASSNTTDFNVVGSWSTQTKTRGISLNGTFEIYTGSPIFVRMIRDYFKNGVLPYFSLNITNDDPATTIGRQVVLVENCKIDGVTNLLSLDADADFLTQTVSFSGVALDIIEEFSNPAEYGVNNIGNI